jgi:hypothetical protein
LPKDVVKRRINTKWNADSQRFEVPSEMEKDENPFGNDLVGQNAEDDLDRSHISDEVKPLNSDHVSSDLRKMKDMGEFRSEYRSVQVAPADATNLEANRAQTS